MSEFISLYSGSSGNCSVVRTGEKYIIIDMGKGVRTTSAALKELGLNISDCAGILVTHEHSDHVKGLATFLKKNPLPVYGADDTLDFLDANGIVPASCANTPPRSISPTRSTGAFAIFAIPIFTISSVFRLISAGLPAPSITMISFSDASLS